MSSGGRTFRLRAGIFSGLALTVGLGRVGVILTLGRKRFTTSTPFSIYHTSISGMAYSPVGVARLVTFSACSDGIGCMHGLTTGCTLLICHAGNKSWPSQNATSHRSDGLSGRPMSVTTIITVMATLSVSITIEAPRLF